MKVLGIETSCDETAAAVVTAEGEILSNVVLSQLEQHAPFGGVVPEIAARAHVEQVDAIVRQAMAEAGLDYGDLDAVAATAGPGLIGGVMVGLMTGKAIAAVAKKPFVAVNHLEGHALTARLTNDVPFPYLLALVSGGHCQLLMVEGVGQYKRLGTTIDDAIGEAFDKVAKMLDLGYPGGPRVEQAAKDGDAKRFAFPRPLKGRKDCHFSFSGLKTAVRNAIEGLAEAPSPQDVSDICASFQAAVGDVFKDRTKRAIEAFKEAHPGGKHLVVAGGVAANLELRAALDAVASDHGLTLVAPPLKLCTDNGAMIAWAGLEHFKRGQVDPLDTAPKARWPLDPQAPSAPGAGVKA